MVGAYPTAELSWQYNINQTVGTNNAYQTDVQNIMRTIKTSLCGFALNPWTVVSSSNSTSAGATDYWTADGYLVWNTTGNTRSWIVLRALSGSQLCIDLKSSSASTYANANIIFSAASGFTGGNTSTRPTATDEIAILGGATNAAWGVATTAQTGKLHVWHSTDGYHTRIVYCRAGTPTLFAFVDKVTVQTGITWSTPIVAAWLGHASTSQATSANISDAYGIDGYHTSAAIDLAASMESYATVLPTARSSPLTTIADYWAINPILGLWSVTASHTGKFAMPSSAGKSALPDMFFSSTTTPTGTGYVNPSGYTYWAQFGNIVLPWDNSIVGIA